MTGPAVAAVRRAVRAFLETVEAPPELCVAVSGGADSLALAEATAHVGHRRGHVVRALVVDHGLQEGSAKVAADAAAAAKALGADEAEVRRADVTGPGGPEAAARKARYRTLSGHGLVLLGHTLDDQAETVLLGLGRGSGPRSVAGMRPHDPPWGRPLLAVGRATTRAACAELGVEPWDDPHNAEPRFTRVRLRTEVLPLLEDVLNGGVAAALARTAAQLREDNEALDTMADMIFTRAGGAEGLDAGVLGAEPAALRRRVLRRWLLQSGVRELTDAHLRAVDDLVARWRGQGGVWLPGNLEASRCRGRLCLTSQPTTRGE
ncbi:MULTISPECIES: tRNA lysidine(34) synthetase TilS [unclassified Amycolatopsis]|uniref:tRNA lysidine(34) synthetase TilS n=1 Tax=unclassified Amycolatopsis TaxID=2618356 RepID=UPI002876340D|nr:MULTISPECIES: tRNA lysidine(34) synthetase TilS [unclassified Amycolatopsis]MDS0133680.1 tRNA lysidine(34) synthetase TilS [Amycolatopsis sp. 505]MDS0148475.1 tRNA lysidine(34) synthetase TilS [Amycolatopsis sp. CM201R]